MIKVEELSYSFPEKDLYKDVSFTIEDGQHAVLIGSNGTGKTTLVDILLNDEKYLYDGKIIRGTNLTHAEYKIKDFIKWVRVEVCDSNGNYAWSNIIRI